MFKSCICVIDFCGIMGVKLIESNNLQLLLKAVEAEVKNIDKENAETVFAMVKIKDKIYFIDENGAVEV